MLNEFKQYLLGIGKSENTALNYCDKVKLYFKWCLDSFGSEPQQLYRANVLDYISYMKTIKRYSPKSVNNHLSSLRSFNEFLIFSGRQTELAIVKNDFMKIQTQYANPCTVEQKDVEAFRQRLLEGGNKRDLRFVAEKLSKRPESVKLLILVSDGQPAADGYYGTAAEEDLRGIKQEYQRKGILFIAAAIGNDKQNIERIYGDSFLDICDLNQLPTKLTNVVKRHVRV